jgi:hypothetical protein
MRRTLHFVLPCARRPRDHRVAQGTDALSTFSQATPERPGASGVAIADDATA